MSQDNGAGRPCPPVDELELNGWPERDDTPRQQRIEQGGELAEVYEVIDRLGEGKR